MSTENIPPVQEPDWGVSWRDMHPEVASEQTTPATKWSTRLEGGCPACVAKHLGQAILQLEQITNRAFNPDERAFMFAAKALILNDEALLGYPGHKWLAAASIAGMEALILPTNAAAAEGVRELRLLYLADKVGCHDLQYRLGAALGRWRPVETSDLSDILSRARGWANLSEALAELPKDDIDNRRDLTAAFSEPDPVPSASRVLKNVVETYCLEGE